jgi:nitrogen fixation protein NifU and related proteins
MNLYQDHILDHYHNPRHFGLLTNATHQAEALNPTCGDKLTLSLIVENGVIKNIGFEGVGCAISLASASILYDSLIGSQVKEACEIEPTQVLKITGIAISPGRMKCALLSLETLKKALCGRIEESK